MQRLIVTTTKRHVRADEPSGFIYALDLQKGVILRKSEIIEAPFRAADTNPRGGLRGAKGIAVRPGEIAIANPSLVFRYDRSWNLLGCTTHPSCAGIHDIAFEGDSLLLTSSRTDTLFQFDLQGRLLEHNHLRTSARSVEGLQWAAPTLLTDGQIEEGSLDFRDPGTHRQEDYDRAHLNSVCSLPGGDRLISLGQLITPNFARWIGAKNTLIRMGVWPWLLRINRGLARAFHLRRDLHSDLIARPAESSSAVLRLSAGGGASLCLSVPDVTAPCHSLLRLADETVIYLDTNSGSVIRFHPDRAGVISTTKVTEGFLRGAAQIGDDTLALGSKADLLIFSLGEGRVISRFRLSEAPNESVFDIDGLPSEFPLPPESFARHLVESTGGSAMDLLRGGWVRPGAGAGRLDQVKGSGGR